jgi:hypothetical protein
MPALSRTHRPTRPALVVLLAALALPAAAGQVYRWVGPDVVVQYSAQPPRGVPAEPVSVQRGSVSPEEASTELQRLRERAGLGEAPAAAGAPVPPRPTAEQQAQREQARAENCRIARENLRVLESARRVMAPNDQGEPVRLDDEQRQARLEETRRQIEQYCNPSP